MRFEARGWSGGTPRESYRHSGLHLAAILLLRSPLGSCERRQQAVSQSPARTPGAERKTVWCIRWTSSIPTP